MAAKSWTSTLRLPKTAFPARASSAEQTKYLQRCTSELYKWQSETRLKESTFVLHDGPPYANGGLHVGHALNKISKDMINRVQLRQGKRVHYIPGWDCHGLPIEHKALQKHPELAKIEDRRARAVETRKVARELATETVGLQMDGFRSWGIMGDWERPYRTMDRGFEMRQLGVFKKMVQRGLIYRRFKPVYWSPSSGTALAEAELEYDEKHVSFSAIVRFPLTKVPDSIRNHGKINGDTVSAVIWTTTPWTLPANRAIAVHNNLEYTIVQSQTYGKLLVAKSRLEYIQGLLKEELEVLIDSISGLELSSGVEYTGLFGNGPAVQHVIPADFVTADSGSGLVHCAPGHGMEDYQVCLARGVEAFAPVDGAGRFTEEAFPARPGLLKGLQVQKEGNKAVLDHLEAQGLVLNRHKYVHKYPYDWRTKQPIIVRATAQWFADVSDIRDQAVEALRDVTCIPPTGKARLESLVKNRSEWCISRQRAWGVPIPALYHSETGEAVMTPESVQHIMNVIEERGIDSWWTDAEDSPEWIPEGLRDSAKYRRGTDTMDVWFDSGTSWSLLAEEGHPAPADVYLEGKDQHRGWFQSSLLTNVACQLTTSASPNQITAPFKKLITHGFTLDQAGRKMSKSIGNVIAPHEIIDGTLLPPLKKRKDKKAAAAQPAAGDTSGPLYDSLGPDMLRLWVASSDYTKDVVIGTTVLKSITSSLQKYRVTFKLLLGSLTDFNPSNASHNLPHSSLLDIDKYALSTLSTAVTSINSSYIDSEFFKAIATLNRWVSHDFSSLYIEAVKDRLYAEAENSTARRSVQTVLWHVLTQLQSVLGPVCPLLVEESWEFSTEEMKAFWNGVGPLRRTEAESLPGLEGTTSASSANEEALMQRMGVLITPFDAVRIAQERARKEKAMGASVQSCVALVLQRDATASDAQDAVLETFVTTAPEQLAELYVVSELTLEVRDDGAAASAPSHLTGAAWVQTEDFAITAADGAEVKGTVYVHAPEKAKCDRCWKFVVEEAEKSEEDGNVCRRCRDVVAKTERSV